MNKEEQGMDPTYHSLDRKKIQGCYPSSLGSLGIGNLERNLVPGQAAGHQGCCVSHCIPCSQSGKEPGETHQGQLQCKTRHHQSHHESIDTESTEHSFATWKSFNHSSEDCLITGMFFYTVFLRN